MGLFNAVMALSGMIDTDVIEDERLARHTSYRIGGKAETIPQTILFTRSFRPYSVIRIKKTFISPSATAG